MLLWDQFRRLIPNKPVNFFCLIFAVKGTRVVGNIYFVSWSMMVDIKGVRIFLCAVIEDFLLDVA